MTHEHMQSEQLQSERTQSDHIQVKNMQNARTQTNHTHEHTAATHQNRLIATLLLTGTIFIAEVIGSALTQSLALLVDAGHMLTDISVLTASTITAILMRRKPSSDKTWGWARLEILTAAAGSIVLLFVGLYAIVEAAMRLFGSTHSGVQDPSLLLIFGCIGLAANVGSIAILATDRNSNLNMRAAFLEVMNDALGSVAVILSAVIMMLTGWHGVDALAGAGIAILMIPRACALLHKAVRILLEETPQGLDLDAVREHLSKVPHVIAVHDLHASTVATGLPRLSAHVVVEKNLSLQEAGDVLHNLQYCLRKHFPVSIAHTTFQIEPEGYQSSTHETTVHQ